MQLTKGLWPESKINKNTNKQTMNRNRTTNEQRNLNTIYANYHVFLPLMKNRTMTTITKKKKTVTTDNNMEPKQITTAKDWLWVLAERWVSIQFSLNESTNESTLLWVWNEWKICGETDIFAYVDHPCWLIHEQKKKENLTQKPKRK